jgi:hypothetical protein
VFFKTSLNALAQISAPRFWKQWLHEPLASADTLGRVHAALYADQLGKASSWSINS